MSIFIIPEIDATGKYKFKAPFDSLGNDQTEFTCMSIRRLTDLLSSGENPYKKYYQPYGIIESDYDADVANNVSIIGLQSTMGSWLYIPNSYLLSYPDVSGVRYVLMVLGVHVGAIAETTNLEPIMGEIDDLIFSRLGIRAEIKPVIVSQPSLVGYDDHEVIEQVRKNNIIDEKPISVQLLDAQRRISELTSQLEKLSEYIKNNN